ncbi:MAG: SAM-dependent methyltransferase, partial [Burkholderiales bacterium]
MPPGILYVVATPIGNLADAGARALDTLRRADLVACEDTRTTRTLLARHGIERATLALHAHNERAAGAKLLAELQAGRSVALVCDAGTPGVS